MSGRSGDTGIPLLLAVHSARFGGAQAMALAEATYLSPRFRLVVSIPQGPLRERFEAYGELVRSSPLLPVWEASAGRWVMQVLRAACDSLRLAVLIRRRGIRVVVTNSTVLLAPVLAARLTRVPVIVHAREWPMSRLSRLLFRLHGLLADTVIPISGGVEARLGATRRARLVRIPDGIPIPATSSPRPERDGFHTPLRLCVVGTLSADRGKGQDLALEALSELVERGIDATLDIVGPAPDPSFPDELRRIAGRLGLSERVHIRGECEDVRALLLSMDILLFCSRQGADVTPLVVMEALAQERPVVATNVGSVCEVVIAEKTGLLVPPNDHVALAEAVSRLVANPRWAAELAARGREHIAAHYDVGLGLKGLLEEIERLLRHPVGEQELT